MATTKTTKSKKTAEKKSTAKSSLVASRVTSNKSSMTVGKAIAKNRKIILILGGVIILAAILFMARGLFIAATVNGQPISRLAVIQELEKQSGQQALEKAITKSLVFQEASKKNVTATEEDVKKEIEKISKQFKDQGQDLNQLLTSQGIKQEDFKEDIRLQVVVQKILGDKVKVSDKEFEEFLAKNQNLISAEKDPETAKKNLKLQLQQQKLSEKYQEWIANLKKNATIRQFVEYTKIPQ